MNKKFNPENVKASQMMQTYLGNDADTSEALDFITSSQSISLAVVDDDVIPVHSFEYFITTVVSINEIMLAKRR
jgi:hypothetical protein